MQKLLRRALHVYRNEGLISTIEKSARFVPRYVRHVLGTKGLYGSPRYRKLLCWWNSRPYSAVADPFKIVRVDPTEITHVTGRGPNPGRFQWQDLGTVQGGDWDQSDERVEDLPVVQALRQRFEDGKEWEDIEFIQHVLEQAERGHVIWRGCASEEDVWEACTRVDRLYERIRDQGYRSKQELVQQGELFPDKYVEGDRFNCYDEVIVDVGRDGQFLFVDGRHRLGIAKILELEEIPVRISARHAQWQQLREPLHETPVEEVPSTVEQHIDHPDLQELIESGEKI
ncbi:ParB/RepB/Spo0J family partition protein [Natronobeatus ordinarius]|uniref:ParB/RepB/Spo0J family partition protein n=1 Tax=Natronobeatus ordinarius TaxID=2963433 RepID=UPI0020CBF045|nr:ParB/RepB/Spo0J family partition protein [Natronobeatus ordinarius]